MAADMEGEDENRVCRICQDDDAVADLISPCNCKGTLAYAHVACLERWLQQSIRRTCELCGYAFNSERTLHYNLFLGLLTWFFKSNTPMGLEDTVYRNVCVDMFNLGLLTVVFNLLYYIFILTADYFIISSMLVITSWACVCLCAVTLILSLRYYYYMYSTISYHFELWFYWWQSNCTVRVISKSSKYLLSRGSAQSFTPRTTMANFVLAETNLPGTVDLQNGNSGIPTRGELVPVEAVPHGGEKDKLSEFCYSEESAPSSTTTTGSVRSTSTRGARSSVEISDDDHLNTDVTEFLQEVMCSVLMRLDSNMKSSEETPSDDQSGVPSFPKPSTSGVISARVATSQRNPLKEKRLTNRSHGSHPVSSAPDSTTHPSTSLSSEFTE